LQFSWIGRLSLIAFVLLATTVSLIGQGNKVSSQYVPLADPGYGLYYHDSDDQPSLATRWGYHDGWEDGRRDRNHGDTVEAKDKPHYLRPTNHDLEGRLSRDQYQSLYRQSYQRGYEHGAKH
jgi:hypothetical protein